MKRLQSVCQRLRTIAVVVACGAAISTCFLGAQSSPGYIGDEACIACHEDVMADFKSTSHGSLAQHQLPQGVQTCESCHGPGSVHAESGEVSDILAFARLSQDAATAACMTCHYENSYATFAVGEHARADVGCTSCHDVHSTREQNLLKRDPDLCFSCHHDIAGKMSLPSRHPVRDGKMNCSDCHDVHSGVGSIKSAETANDLCFTCHTDKQGPYQFEHAAVVEGCNTCHDPHGTVVNNLLLKGEPYLCLQCHHIHFQIAEHLDVRATASARCTQCHIAVHGSDSPSSVKSGGGRGLTR